MNDGQTNTVTPNNSQPFFTTGPGVNSTNANNVAPEDNLDLDNQNWDTSITRDVRTIGGTTMASTVTMENNPAQEETNPSFGPELTNAPNLPSRPDIMRSQEQSNMTPGLGEIVPLEMPPGVTQDEYPSAEASGESKPSVDEIVPSNFYAKGENISKVSVEATKKLIGGFTSGKIDPATFKRQYTEACQAYQKNSAKGII